MNPNHAIMVKQNLDKLMIAWFIVMVEEVIWLLPIVMVPKKFDKLYICVNFRKLNAIMKKDLYRLRFIEEVLDMVVGHKVYSFLDGFSSYHQIMITLEDQYKTIFIVEWGAFLWLVMRFRLNNVPPTYQWTINRDFKEYFGVFMNLFLDDFNVFNFENTYG